MINTFLLTRLGFDVDYGKQDTLVARTLFPPQAKRWSSEA
jgi:hypothetical protein